MAGATNAASYEWTGPNGFNSTAENPVITNVTTANNGTYTLVVTAEGGCTSTISVVVNNIAPTPTTPTITSNGPVCEDGAISMAVQQQYTGTTITYNWTNGEGITTT